MENRIINKQLAVDCPVCGNQHEYQVRLTQAPIMQPIVKHFDWKRNLGAFTKNFICPEQQSDYLATFEMEVEGIVKDVEIL